MERDAFALSISKLCNRSFECRLPMQFLLKERDVLLSARAGAAIR